MLAVKDLKPNVRELTLEGVLDEDDIGTMARELIPALTGGGPVGFVVHAEGWTDMTADAMVADAKFEVDLPAQCSTIARMAKVTELQAFAAVIR